MNASRPDVTVVIPTRERETMLRRAVGSCFEAAAGEVAVEVLVAVDGDRPGYAASLPSEFPPTQLLPSAQQEGRGRARNRGLEAAAGEWVKFLDDDDWLEPSALAEEVRLGRATGADIVATGHNCRGEAIEDRYVPPPAFANGIDSILAGEAVPTAAALYRRSAIGELRWDEHASKLDDWHFFCRVALRSGRIASLDRPSYTWYAHEGQGIRKASMLDNAREFYWVLDEVESHLAESGQLTDARRRRLAQYRYKELRVLARNDSNMFEQEIERILLLDASYRPGREERQLLIRWAARVLGIRGALKLHERVRRLLVPGARVFPEETRSNKVTHDGKS